MKTLMKNAEIQLNGSNGEGGGQILRTALSLSAITGKPFQLEQIRAGRKRPGLMRQHLTCVRATAELCGAKTSEVSIGSGSLTFSPDRIRGSHQTFSIGTAGSTTLLMQTIFPVLLQAPDASGVTLQGGTHVIKAPCFEYVAEIFLPMIRKLGARTNLHLQRAGFFPAGGGELFLEVEPSTLVPQKWNGSKSAQPVSAEVLNTPEIPASVADKELRKARNAFSIPSEDTWVRSITGTACPGNALLLRSAPSKEAPGTLTSAYGERGKRADQVAKEAIWEMQRYQNSPAPIDEHLADQLLLPLALAGGGSYTATALTPHFHSNTEVIEAFLPIEIHTEKLDRFAWKVTVQS